MTWDNAQKHEAGYWGNCLNYRTWGEFVKQEQYARELGLFEAYGDGSGELLMRGRSVLDIGGGPVSMTLRCLDSPLLVVADPLPWPRSALRRYANYHIDFRQLAGEQLDLPERFDEVWLYNVLQHVASPERVLANACCHLNDVGVLRVFEWVDIPADVMHPHVLTPDRLLNALPGMRLLVGGLRTLADYWANGASAFVGIFTRGRSVYPRS